MKRIKAIQALIVSLSLLCVITACTNNNETTKSAPYDSSTQSNATDTATKMKSDVKDTSMAATAMTSTNKTTASKKKGKATVGSLSERKATTEKNATMKADQNGVYDITEVRPVYPGGQPALSNYVTNHIDYPQMAIDDNKEGTVNVQFVVDENGKVQDAKVVGSKLGDGLDEEAERIISQMPNWKAGTVKGKAVKTRLTLPITYKIEQ